ncbi:MAG: transglutaminase-like cysteine peptidase, partial [Rhizomicrobium sp.]|nr:transglutaminase-like cysteine peptidase [Rhizomicrobium sp.]
QLASALPDNAVPATAPDGFASFCSRFPRQCRAQASAPSTVPLTDSLWRRLYYVNRGINKAIKPETDLAHYGRAEFWTIPADGYGDCEDYALTKRRDLMRAGVPESVLRIAVVDTAKFGRHAVLTVSTDEGDFVLDNLTNQILPWNATGYVWVSAQNHADPMRWDALRAGPDSAIATAAQPANDNQTGLPSPLATPSQSPLR